LIADLESVCEQEINMKLYLKQQPFSLRSRFFIKDDAEQEVYSVEGEFLSLGAKLHVYDQNGREAAFIHQKLLSLMPRYVLDIDGQEIGCIRQRFAIFCSRFDIEGIGWSAEGNFTAHEFIVSSCSQTVMVVRKAWFTWGDSYELDIVEPEDALKAVCVMLAIDMAIAACRNSSAKA
jgi:uncharacterized protein YxjI